MGVERENLQKMRSEQIHHILQQDEQLGREQSMFQDVGQMQANRAVIDQALMKSGEWKLTDKEQYRLRAIQGRTISHLLLNQNQFSTDSPEMSLVKKKVEKLGNGLRRMRRILSSNWRAHTSQRLLPARTIVNIKNRRSGAERNAS